MPAEPVTGGYPFSAVVGAGAAKSAIRCALVNPAIKAVLIRGGGGTGKSTIARAIAGVSSRRIVNCPPGVTEEQLFGGIDIEKALRDGRAEASEGLLERCGGGVMVIDDANLMDPATLASVFDCVATGEARIERGAVSARIPCDFLLVATVRPGEPDLSPHMLDRFDLCAYMEEPGEGERKEALRRGRDFSADPKGFAERHGREEAEEAALIERASRILPAATISDGLASIISELCQRTGAAGCRGDLAMARCSMALAALSGRDEVTKRDVEEAAALCLAHRRGDAPPPPPPDRGGGDGGEEDDDGPPPSGGDEPGESGREPSGEEADRPPPPEGEALPDIEEIMFEIGRQFRVIDYIGAAGERARRTKARKGRRAMAESADGTGRRAGHRIPAGRARDVAFDATIIAAAPHQRDRDRGGLAVKIEEGDLREKIRERRCGCTILFLVDASGSLGARRRMAAVKGAVHSMLRDSYVRRDRVGLMAFRRDSAELVLPPTRSVEYGLRKLEELPTGGRTPLGAALEKAHGYMSSNPGRRQGERLFIVLVTDGRANAPLAEGADATEEARVIAEGLASRGIGWIVVDAGLSYPHFPDAEILAERLRASYFRLEDLDADGLADNVRMVLGA
ncbi:MAG: VWA domain-containing protein [Candidatus Methanoplasma sp.]|jgi:magnesium chelatase subunit D|nr:VWA domain-containing protein [Candidatus Methanoplasma sp.]